MPQFTVPEIVDTLASRVGDEAAEALLAIGLEGAGLPLREAYDADELVAIGRAIVEAQQPVLAASDDAFVRQVHHHLGDLVDTISGR